MSLKLIKIHGNIKKNYIINNNKHFKVVFIKNDICIWYNQLYLIIVSYALIKKYEFYKFIFIIKLHQILFDNNIVIFDYGMYNFKIYLILNLWFILI